MLVLPPEWIQQWRGQDPFERICALQGQIFRAKDGRRTLRFRFGKAYFYAKIHNGVGWRKLLKGLLKLRLPVLSARNEWEAIQRLERLGVPTMQLVGYGRKGRNPARQRSFVITRELTQTVSLETFCRDWPAHPPSPSLKRALIREVARLTRALHTNGMNHRDLYICHFLLALPESTGISISDSPQLFLIDLHRVQIRRRTPRRWRIKDVAALHFSSMDIGLSLRDRLRFMQAYSQLPWRTTLASDASFWRRVDKRGHAFYREYLRKRASRQEDRATISQFGQGENGA
jgi:heptose I phosphotransferase